MNDAIDYVDRYLVDCAVAGDADAFGLLAMKYRSKLMNAVSQYVYDRAETEDVVQDTFINAYRAIGSFKGESAFYTWIYRIALNAANKYLSRKSRRVRNVELTDFIENELIDVVSADTPESALISKQMLSALNMAMSNLTVDHRIVFELFEVDEMSYEDIAKLIGHPIGTVRSRISRARKSLAANI